MARPTTAKFSEFQILIGDGETPVEGFDVVCGLTSKGINRSANTNTTVVPDCADEDAPAFEEVAVNSLSISISGNGVWTAENHGVFLAWFYSGVTKNIKVRHVAADGGTTEYENGPAILTQLNNAAERGQKVSADITIVFDGQPTLVAAA
jgi:hypothetical protein